MRVKDLAEIMGKTPAQVEAMLMKDDIIELNLSERGNGKMQEDEFRIME